MPPPAPRSSWIDFWEKQDTFGDAHFETAARVLVERASPILDLGPDHTLLDLGCGPGWVTDLLAPRVREVHCADIAGRYVSLCEKRFERDEHIHVHALDPSTPTTLPFDDDTFDRTVVNSVVQYFTGIDELESLLAELGRVSREGALCLVSDLPTDHGLRRSAALQVWEAGRRGHLSDALRWIGRAGSGDYRDVLRDSGILRFSREGLTMMLDRQHIDAEIIDRRLTLNALRLHLLIRF